MSISKTSNAAIAAQVSRIASDIESEKNTRAEANRMLIEAIERLRSDMHKHFNGDGDNPGILIRLDRIEQKNFDDIKKKLEMHEEHDDRRFDTLEKYITESKSFNKGAVWVGGVIVTVIVTAVQILTAVFF